MDFGVKIDRHRVVFFFTPNLSQPIQMASLSNIRIQWANSKTSPNKVSLVAIMFLNIRHASRYSIRLESKCLCEIAHCDGRVCIDANRRRHHVYSVYPNIVIAFGCILVNTSWKDTVRVGPFLFFLVIHQAFVPDRELPAVEENGGHERKMMCILYTNMCVCFLWV